MEENSFHQRFRNRSQLISKEGCIELGINAVPKAKVALSKLHFDAVPVKSKKLSLNASILSDYTDATPNKVTNKSFAHLKLPKIEKIYSQSPVFKDLKIGFTGYVANNLKYSKKRIRDSIIPKKFIPSSKSNISLKETLTLLRSN